MAFSERATSVTRIRTAILTNLTVRNDMIATGGENVYSGEVERIIFNHPCGAQKESANFGLLADGKLVTL